MVGFPSDDFKQEAKDEAETAEICFINYGVTFTMLGPSVVKGGDANPVFKELARKSSAPAGTSTILVSADGKVVQHFDSKVDRTRAAQRGNRTTAGVEGALNPRACRHTPITASASMMCTAMTAGQPTR